MCFTTAFKVLAIFLLCYTVNRTQALLQVKMGKEILLPSSKHISLPSYGHGTLHALVLATEKQPIPWDQGVHTTNKPPPSNNLVWSKTQFLHVIPLRPAPTTVLPKRSVYLLFYVTISACTMGILLFCCGVLSAEKCTVHRHSFCQKSNSHHRHRQAPHQAPVKN